MNSNAEFIPTEDNEFLFGILYRSYLLRGNVFGCLFSWLVGW